MRRVQSLEKTDQTERSFLTKVKGEGAAPHLGSKETSAAYDKGDYEVSRVCNAFLQRALAGSLPKA